MKLMLLIFLSVAVFAQDNGDERHEITVIPKADHSATGIFRLLDKLGVDGIVVRAPDDVTTAYEIRLPSLQGGVGTTLVNDGAGNLSWGSTGGAGGNWTRVAGTDFTRIHPATVTDSVNIGSSIDLGAFHYQLLVWDQSSALGSRRTRMILRSGEDQGSQELLSLVANSGASMGGIDAGGNFFTLDPSNSTQPVGIGNYFITFGNASQMCWSEDGNRYGTLDVCLARSATDTLSIKAASAGPSFGNLELNDITIHGSCTGCAAGGYFDRDLSGIVYPSFDTDRLHLGNLATADTGIHGPLLIWRNPGSISSGEVGGIYVNLSSNIGGTPAANDLVGGTFRVTNDAMINSSLWGLNVLVQQSVPISGATNAYVRGIEVEIDNACTDLNFDFLPYSGTGCRANGIELLTHGGTDHDATSALAIFAANNTSGKRWYTGIYVGAVSNRGIWFNGGAGEFQNALVVDNTSAGTIWKTEGGTHTNFFDLTASGFINFFVNASGNDVIGDFFLGNGGVGSEVAFNNSNLRVYGTSAGLHIDNITGYVKAPKIEIRDPIGNTFWDWQANANGPSSRAYLRDNSGNERLSLDSVTAGVTVNNAYLKMHWLPRDDSSWNIGSAGNRWVDLWLVGTAHLNLATINSANITNLTVSSCTGCGSGLSMWTDGFNVTYLNNGDNLAIGQLTANNRLEVNGNIGIVGDLIPTGGNGATDLGTASTRLGSVTIDSNAILQITDGAVQRFSMGSFSGFRMRDASNNTVFSVSPSGTMFVGLNIQTPGGFGTTDSVNVMCSNGSPGTISFSLGVKISDTCP